MKKTYIVNLLVSEKLQLLYEEKITSNNKEIVVVADQVFDTDENIEFYLKSNLVAVFKKQDIVSFYEYENFTPNTLDNLLDEFLLTWNGIVSLGGDSIKKIYHRGLGTNSQYILNCILTDICEETKRQFDENEGNLICSKCFERYQKINDYKENSLVYYGCPNCKQTNRFYSGIAEIVCLLDDRIPLGHYVKNDILYLNWSVISKDFDFDRIIIQNATDLDIERFVVNMSDRGLLNFQKIKLTTTCSLSDNSRKILSKYFIHE